MLLGEFRHALDAKGRVFVPARWRDELSEGVVLAQGLEGCVQLMSATRFAEMGDRLAELPMERKTNRAYARKLFGGASEEAIDKQGRVTVPPPLREHAGLTKEVVLVGVSDRAEIWDRAAWERYISQQDYEAIAEELEL